jgi:hypothetical protein
MISRPLVVGLLAAGCVTAAAGGAYVAVRHNRVEGTALSAAAPGGSPAAPAAVAETEAIVSPPPAAEPAAAPASATAPPAAQRETIPVEAGPAKVQRNPENAATPERSERRNAPADRTPRPGRTAEPSGVPVSSPTPAAATTERTQPSEAHAPVPPLPTVTPDPVERESARIPEPTTRDREMIEVVVPASSVIGLQVDTAVSSERARVEDRVVARVTRDVSADSRVAIPAGSRVLGSVTLVERGGKIKERARLGIRFHTLVLADGTEIPIRTESIFREGESPSGESARKIGGAAAAGAILGAIIGGGKGAAIGGAAGAGGGTAVVMSGDRNAATLPAGTVVSVHLASPVTLTVERQ